MKDRGGGEGREMVDGARKKLLVIKNIQGNNMILFLQPFVLIDNTFYLMTTLPFIDFFSRRFFPLTFFININVAFTFINSTILIFYY